MLRSRQIFGIIMQLVSELGGRKRKKELSLFVDVGLRTALTLLIYFCLLLSSSLFLVSLFLAVLS